MAARQNKHSLKFAVSPFYFVMAAAMVLFGGGGEIIIYTVAVVLHEMAHAEVSQRLGYTLSSFKLMPYGASLKGDFESVRLKDEVLIALAGPMFNLLLTVPSVALWWLLPQSYYVTQTFVRANIFIALFNIVPVFPLDGGRILLALLGQKYPKNKAYKGIRLAGYVFAFILSALFAISLFYRANISFGITAVFVFASTIIPDKNCYYQRLYSMAYRSQSIKRGLVVREIMVMSDSTVLMLTKLLNGNYFTRFVVMSPQLKPLFCITETELEDLKCSPSDSILFAAKNKPTTESFSQKINPLQNRFHNS